MDKLNQTIELENLTRAFNRVVLENRQLEQQLIIEKERALKNIQLKERELSTATILVHQKDELLEYVLSTINELKQKHNGSTYPELHNLAYRLRSHVRVHKSWEKLKTHFEQVHPGFFQNLRNISERLTANENKLCAFLRIGLRNKEIAQLNDVTDATVRKALNRLKKKFGLDATQSIRHFIMDVA